jgi:hyaluronan synthase
VLCCCGSLSFYRADVVRANLDDFVTQRFLGQVATFGDDRRLTNYALRAGRVVLRESSIARTAVPERLGHYLRQQIRWNKSFVRESVWVLGTFPFTHAAFWLTLLEVVSWAVAGSITFAALLIVPFVMRVDRVGLIVAVIALAAYARNAAYLGAHTRTGVQPGERLLVFALAPLYAAIHVGLLVPLRLWSLVTLRRTRWGTRARVEVHLAR